MQNMQFPWELKEEMFRQSLKNSDIEVDTNCEDALLVALFYGFGFGTSKEIGKMPDWCVKAASRGSTLAKVLVHPFSNLSMNELESDTPISRWLIEAIEKLTNTVHVENLTLASHVLEKFD